MTVKLTREEQREAYEWGVIERDAAQLRDLSPAGGWLARFWSWIESLARNERECIRDGIGRAPASSKEEGDASLS